ncbi:MAG TPA: hypothetical protein VKZ65_02455, partial [Glycomyces sp.]|nr:hypothetical protein [Glycomyces sp.]
MSDSGMIEGSAPSGETGGEYVTIHSADSASYEDTAFVYEYDEGVYETEEYTDVTTAAPSSTIAFGDTSALEYGGERAGCTAGACPHPVAHPAEAEWEQLVSAVPTEGQLHRFKPRCEGMSYPTEDDFRAAIGAVRPLDPDAFSLSRLRIGWQEEVAAVLAEWPGLIRTRLTGLAEGWAGEDFDLFTDRTDQMRSLVQGVLDDIEDTVRELENRESSIYTLQGGDSGEIPYPAPMVGVEGEWTNLVAIHVRPAWWHGDCILMSCEEAERALELGGADPKLATDVRTFIEGQAGGPIVPGDASEARVLAGDEAATSFEGRISAELAAYAERHAAIDEAIAEKRAGQSEQLESMRTTGSDRPCPDGADSAHMDTEVPVMEEPAPPVPPQATQDPSPVPPGGDGSVAADPSSPETTSEERSWEEPALAEDGTAAGGLAGGGGFG